MKAELISKVGADIDGKHIELGWKREQVVSVLGDPEMAFEHDWYYKGALALDYDDKGVLLYIECRRGTNTGLFGRNVFEMQADDVYDMLVNENGDDITDEDDGYSYVFNNICVSVWRETIPSDVEEMIEEAGEEGETVTDEDLAEEWDNATHWDAVGIFAPGYYGQ